MVDPPGTVVCNQRGNPAVDQGAGMVAADYGYCICLSAHIENLYRTKCEVGEFSMMLGRSRECSPHSQPVA